MMTVAQAGALVEYRYRTLAAHPTVPPLPVLYPRQQAIADAPARRKVVCAGRRVGKTTAAAAVGVTRFLAGRQVLFASPTQEQVDVFWDKCKLWLDADLHAGRVIKNETRRLLTMPGAPGRLRAKTAYDADSLRGDYADFLVLDECALLAPNAWHEVGAPMLADNDGEAWFLSTPRRQNWFFTLYQRAVAEGGRWAAFHLTTLDNPYLSPDGVAALVEDMTEDTYRQEILAEFLEGEGAVFRNITANLTAPVTTPADHAGHRLLMGVDWGQTRDYTALSVGCVTCGMEVALDRFNQIGWAVQRARLAALAATWGVVGILAERNSMGSPNIEALAAEGLPVQGFDTTAASKEPLIQALALDFERATWRWLDVPAATAELAAYEQRVSKITGHTTYSAPEGLHDDTVMARALMRRAAKALRQAWSGDAEDYPL
jgi:terminase large subunit-like protein